MTKSKNACPECGGLCTISWSGLEKKHYHSKSPEMLALLVKAKETIGFCLDQLKYEQGIHGGYEWEIKQAEQTLTEITKLLEE